SLHVEPQHVGRHDISGLELEASGNEEEGFLSGKRSERRELRPDALEHLADLRSLLRRVMLGELQLRFLFVAYPRREVDVVQRLTLGEKPGHPDSLLLDPGKRRGKDFLARDPLREIARTAVEEKDARPVVRR